MNNQQKAQNPMSEYLLKIQLIITNSEFKNNTEANEYETLETKLAGDAYIKAVNGTDTFDSYTYDPIKVYNTLEKAGYTDEQIHHYLSTLQTIPQSIKNQLMSDERAILISKYVEKNKYYARLTGTPFVGNDSEPPEEVVLIPDEFYMLYKTDNVLERNQPIHEMPLKYQELFMNSDYYKKALKEYPNVKYLQYIGSNKIPITISRAAKDGAILRINTSKLSTYHPIFGNVSVSPDIIHSYVSSYNKTRDYVYGKLRGNFSQIYPNYDSFIRFLTIYLSIGNALNEFMHKSTSMISMNEVTANSFFMLYGLPSVIMGGASMNEFLTKFRMLLVDKGTNTVYRVKDLIGYEYTDIYTLVMVKQQCFENGIPLYYYDEDGTKHPKYNIVFRRLGTTSDNTSYFKSRESDVTYSYEEIRDGDPRWWNTPEVEQMLYDMNYSLSNSKYIQLSTHLSMTDIWWQCTILIRGLLDMKQETNFTKLNINYNINGSSELSIFEAILVLIILMNWHLIDANERHLNGDIYLPNGYYDGKYTCLDLLFNGLYSACRYKQNQIYTKSQLVGIKPDELYEVTETFTSDNTKGTVSESLQYDVSLNHLKRVNGIDDGKPKQLKLGAPFKISSFNFRIRGEQPELYYSIKSMEYLEPDKLLPMLERVLDREYSNIGEVLMKDIRLIYKYLETKLREARTISEFRQVTDVYSALFLVDPQRDWYDDTQFNTDAVLMDEYNITLLELDSLKRFFHQNEIDLNVTFEDKLYPISLYQVLNTNASDVEVLTIYPFRNDEFVNAFSESMKTFVSNQLLSSFISSNIKNNYQSIIIDKVALDVGNTSDGPKSFESLLFRTNQSLYKYIMDTKKNGENSLMLMRSIIKTLENYTNSKLSGLEFNALGVDEYFRILKDVISYFKSYMIEYTKDEFVYIFDGLFDMGGHSNMLSLHDEISHTTLNILPVDSLALFDISHIESYNNMNDSGMTGVYDEMIVRIEGKYSDMLNTGYEVWYDDGKRISKVPFDIDPETKLVVNLAKIEDSSVSSYKIIINIKNLDVVPPNYYGNTR